jgi:hypothetical protein
MSQCTPSKINYDNDNVYDSKLESWVFDIKVTNCCGNDIASMSK